MTAPRPSRTLNIFDLDDTLFLSDSKINVFRGKQLVKILTTHELMHYTLRDGERFDFSQFRCGKTFYDTAKPIKSMLNVAKTTLNGVDKTIILTARGDLTDKETFLKKFKDCKFPIEKVYIERAGNVSNAGSAKGVGENKKTIIRTHLNRGVFGKAKMWDDAKSNLDAFLELREEYREIVFHAFLVNPEKGTFHRFK